jgi:hypothetical protein
MSTELVVSERKQGFMECTTLEQAIRVSEIIAASNFCPANLKGKPGDILICLQFGQEVGLKPMASIQNIAPINGRPSIWGDAMIALCQQSPDCEYINEYFDDKSMVATCTVKRKNHAEHTKSFSQEKAKEANLWKKAGPWTQYPERMLQMRARGFALRDKFSDVLKGLIIKEEAEDYPTEQINHRNIENSKKVEGVTIENEYQSNDLINDDQIIELVTLAKEIGANLKKACDYLNIDSLDEMTTVQCQKLMRQFERELLKRDELNIPDSNNDESSMTDTAQEFFGEQAA